MWLIRDSLGTSICIWLSLVITGLDYWTHPNCLVQCATEAKHARSNFCFPKVAPSACWGLASVVEASSRICACALLLFQHNAQMLFGLQLFPCYAQHNRLKPSCWAVLKVNKLLKDPLHKKHHRQYCSIRMEILPVQQQDGSFGTAWLNNRRSVKISHTNKMKTAVNGMLQQQEDRAILWVSILSLHICCNSGIQCVGCPNTWKIRYN